jgi:hypothetical protein
MRRISLALALTAAMAVTARAITYGTPDGNAHPNVGLLIGLVSPTEALICSGTLVAPRIFLTAGHCVQPLQKGSLPTFVTFQSVPTFGPGTIIPGVPIAHPSFGQSFPDTADIGVVVLASVPAGIVPARIPQEGFLDQFATSRGQSDVYFSHVGYGTQSVRPFPSFDLVRYFGVSSLVNLRNALTDGFNLQTTANPGRGRSGICFGDSGGPAFFEDTNVVAGIHSFVMSPNCIGSAVSYRVDSPTALAFLAQFRVFPSTK